MLNNMDELTWYGKQSECETAAFGALALIEPLIQKVDLVRIINQHLPVDIQAEFDHGSILSLLVAARLHSPLALRNVSDWACQSGADVLFGIPAEKLNDDRLGRSLDAFFKQRHSILASLALYISSKFNIPLDRLHYDPTHIAFAGVYAESEARDDTPEYDGLSDIDLKPAHITKGKGTDDAPRGTRMIHAGLTTYIDEYGPLPIFGHTMSGNQNGHTGIRQQLAHVLKHLKPQKFTMLSDRGTFSVGHLLRLQDVESHAICSVPWGEVKKLFVEKFPHMKWKQASFLSIEQQRRRDQDSSLPLEHYELSVLEHDFHDNESKRSISTRVIFVFSTADKKVLQQQRNKKIERIKTDLLQIERSVAAGRYNNKLASVKTRIERAMGDGLANPYFTWELQALSEEERQRATRDPSISGSRPPTHRLVWQFDEAAVAEDEKQDGYSAIVTTVPKSIHSADAVFTMFREQNLVEHVNRQFKGPLAVRPVFLHSPHRVEALVFLLMIALMLYFLLQRSYRQNTPEDEPLTEHRMTAATLLKAFQGYAIIIQESKAGRIVSPSRLTPAQRKIINRLKFPTPAQTLSRRLAKPPD